MGAEQILLGAVAGAGIVLSGALYALFFALGRLRRSPLLSRVAWGAYGLLVACTVLLTAVLGLGGPWRWIIAALLVGYLAAPSAIWHLSVATHVDEDRSDPRSAASRS